MDKHLLRLVWGLPESFALPSVAACRRALTRIGPRLVPMQAGKDRRRFARPRLTLNCYSR